MSFAKDVLENPELLVYPIVHNNTADVAANLTEVSYQLTKSGYMNTLYTMWDGGKKERVMEILNVPYKPSVGPDFLDEYMAEYANSNDTVIMTYNRQNQDAKQTESIVAADIDKNVTIGAAVIILLVIFIFYVK